MAAAPSPINVVHNTSYVNNVQATDSAGIAAQGFALARDFAQRAAVQAAHSVASMASSRHDAVMAQQRDALTNEANQVIQRNAKAFADEQQRYEESARQQDALLRSQGATLIINERTSSSAALMAAEATMAAQTQRMHELEAAVQHATAREQRSAEAAREALHAEIAMEQAAQRASASSGPAGVSHPIYGSASAINNNDSKPPKFTTNGTRI
jgi:hypothetical protein